MRVILCNQNKLSKLVLPDKVEGSFWLVDEFTNQNIANIEAINGNWILKGNINVKIYTNNVEQTSLTLVSNTYCNLIYEEKNLLAFFEDNFDNSFGFYNVNNGLELHAGTNNNFDIVYNLFNFDDCFTLLYNNNVWRINCTVNSNLYLNDNLIISSSTLINYGDYLFCNGLKIYFYKDMISFNNPNGIVKLNGNKLSLRNLKSEIVNDVQQNNAEIKEIDLYKDSDYFFKKARIRRFVESYDLKITRPPNKQEKEDPPLIVTLGPMLTMAIVSCTTFGTNISKILSGQQDLKTSWPTLLTSVATLLASLLWPNISKNYQKKLNKRKEKNRQLKYNDYIEKKKLEINDVKKVQSDILKENLLTVKDCENIILGKKINFWERSNEHKDFLTVRVGIGNIPIEMNIQYEEDDFSLEKDPLLEKIENEVEVAKMLYNVPIGYSFLNKKVTAVMGIEPYVYNFVDNLLLQLLTFHSYDDLKIIFLVNKKHLFFWKKYKEIPHVFSNNKKNRYFATNNEDAKFVSSFLMQELVNRLNNLQDESESNEVNEKTFSPYYLIITDDYPMIRKLDIVKSILNIKDNVGFSLLCIENQLRRLPGECCDFIYLNKNNSTILCTDIDNYKQQQFISEEISEENINYTECMKKLSNIPIEFNEDNRKLPTMLGFLEMYNIGKVEQFNLLNRWRLNDPIQSLRAQVGINDEGNPIYLDLHEKYHGPHGLIAGTTGSGKSEFIITFILSLAINYSPNEVAFILIDYKGGGLAGAFENKSQGIKLPHLAGTITNLDKSSLNRTLVSINSELKRRQMKFNEVRDKLGESTIDIYKYQKFFREKKISEPMPHLFIISDEFAELKNQQPEFMDDLISAARIGRSLGIHLILATQKPSGVVNDQIWSNTKFRVCLKVQDAADSNEMLKCPDAATITNAGRFYLQVGTNEIFILGQSGWAGKNYIPSETVKSNYDRSLSIIDDVGNVIKNVEDDVKLQIKANDNNGDELSNTLKYICNLANKENICVNSLWLDNIPGEIFVNDIINKYNFKIDKNVTAVLGEYDAPSKQYQNILTLKLNEDGNTIVYGVSGANREMFLSSLIYSVCINYSSEMVNFYIIDYGSETLRMYNQFPQVGDIVFSSESDKLNKLIINIQNEIMARKKLFAEYNGEYNTYLKLSGKSLPLMVIIINNFDALKENLPDIVDILIKLTREGERYGIVFVISAVNGRSIYSKILTNFHNFYVLDMQDRMDYIEIIGKIGNIYPAEYDGRGLFRDDDVYEFQTASIFPTDVLTEKIRAVGEELKVKCNNVVAKRIPSLPEVLKVEDMVNYVTNINSLPIGIVRRNLKICNYDFFKSKATVISSKNLIDCVDLLRTIINDIRKLNQMIVLIDTEKELSALGGTVNTYVDSNFEDFILRFEDFLDKEVEGKQINVLCIITGLEKFQGNLKNKKALGFFNGIKLFDNVSLIFVDSSYKIKKVGYENWYSSLVDNTNGIWVGSGFADQSVFSVGYGKETRENVNKQFAWVLKNGECELIKIAGDKEEEDE